MHRTTSCCSQLLSLQDTTSQFDSCEFLCRGFARCCHSKSPIFIPRIPITGMPVRRCPVDTKIPASPCHFRLSTVHMTL
ncbi:hypothetical protein BDZ94DRAFT_1242818 [Collybia nuda]|uniref:Uncharacterized protein n=1 Tax=Collybia nuda TaxID=64659 RepID=A0A9P5YJ93_9AGAR|nr:hypothetical protein BDZ94DRAFT_1242818 [Collybia nuda]